MIRTREPPGVRQRAPGDDDAVQKGLLGDISSHKPSEQALRTFATENKRAKKKKNGYSEPP